MGHDILQADALLRRLDDSQTGIGSHRNLGGGPIHSARIPETMWFNPENVWDSTTQTVYSVTRLSEIQLQIVPSYCSEYSHPSPPDFSGGS